MIKAYFENTEIGQKLYSLGYVMEDLGCDDIRSPYSGYFRVKNYGM